MSFKLVGVSRTFESDRGEVAALGDVSFAVNGAEFVSIVGPSGCGKTTLLRIIAGLIAPTTGRIEWNGSGSDQLKTALVFQDHGLLPWYDVLRNVALGLELQGVPRDERETRARPFLEQFGLSRFIHNFPHELSMGMRQRVAIARAFVAEADVLLLDEPFGSLDAQTRIVLQEELLRIWRDHRKLVVHVTHDIEEAILLSDRVFLMTGRPGAIREEITIPLGRPRPLRALDRPEVSEIRWHIWKALEEEVRESFLRRS